MDNITFIYGERKIILKPPVIRTVFIKRKFWFNKTEWYVDLGSCTVSVGPFERYSDAYEIYSASLPYMK